MKRNYNLLSHLPPQDLRFVQLSGVEEISKLFNLNLTLQSPRGDINPADMIGKPLTLEIAMQGGVRHINGQCSHFICTGKHGRHYAYLATIQPWLWYATRRQDYRIFQHKTVPEMVQEVLGTYGFELRLELSKSYRTWEYCVQYRETDANFVMTGEGGLVEIQATAEKTPFAQDEFLKLLDLARGGIAQLTELQRKAVA